jgi:hydrogenase maturation protease
MKIVVLGLGNPIRTDDGVGIHAIHRVSNLVPHSVQVLEGGTLGLDLLPSLRGVSHLLVLDAVDIGGPPGSLSQFADAELALLPVSKSVHLLGFVDLLSTLKLLEDSPDKVMLIGIQPESTEWGVRLSPAVDATLNDLVEASLVQISDWIESTADNVKSVPSNLPQCNRHRWESAEGVPS